MNDEDILTEEEQALHARLAALKQEHADLDASIEALGHMPVPDQLMIARLKRKKLNMKDEMMRIEAIILPDIIA